MNAPAPRSQPDIVGRLRSACDGHPHAKIEWPHRILHEAADEIASLKSQVERMTALEMRVIALEQVISEEVYPENCSDDCNRMLLESAIESHHRRIKARSALSLEDRK